jgi:uncharacterized protein (UPF0332 family)
MNNKDKNISIAIKLRKAKATLNEIGQLLQFAYFNTALNRLYYACFYAVQALLLSKDLAPKSHKGIRTLFSQHFIKEKKFPEELNGFYTRIFDERQFADYMDVEEFDKESIHLLFEKAKIFIAHIEKLLDEKK